MRHAATTSYNIDLVWYVNNVTTDHITSDLHKLTMKETYGRQDQVLAAKG
jgi:hypothetical protein